MLCEQGNPSQCYQPSDKNLLKVYRATSVTYQVTPGAGAHISSIIPASVQTVNAGTTLQFTVNAETSYVVEAVPGGTCPLGQWAGTTYTTGAITSNCTVLFNAHNNKPP
ncbi:hypothetical protein [uncultured Legionella sp.]|uniref:hypothetical protein n=1 Tax=uncultured Legionella sp. TaxID=210934 RepID=UPI00261182B1|nr:hypothetical protein [uncultured Legionella sp.]